MQLFSRWQGAALRGHARRMLTGPLPFCDEFDRSHFDCGEYYINRAVAQYARERTAATEGFMHLSYIETEGDKSRLVAYAAASLETMHDTRIKKLETGDTGLSSLAVRLLVLAVHKEHQRKGIGRALLFSCLATLLDDDEKRAHTRGVTLFAEWDAVPFYEKLGFRMADPVKVGMWLPLEAAPEASLIPLRPDFSGQGRAVAVAKKGGPAAG